MYHEGHPAHNPAPSAVALMANVTMRPLKHHMHYVKRSPIPNPFPALSKEIKVASCTAHNKPCIEPVAGSFT